MLWNGWGQRQAPCVQLPMLGTFLHGDADQVGVALAVVQLSPVSPGSSHMLQVGCTSVGVSRLLLHQDLVMLCWDRVKSPRGQCQGLLVAPVNGQQGTAGS